MLTFVMISLLPMRIRHSIRPFAVLNVFKLKLREKIGTCHNFQSTPTARMLLGIEFEVPPRPSEKRCKFNANGVESPLQTSGCGHESSMLSYQEFPEELFAELM